LFYKMIWLLFELAVIAIGIVALLILADFVYRLWCKYQARRIDRNWQRLAEALEKEEKSDKEQQP
jgi:hypothetical protein